MNFDALPVNCDDEEEEVHPALEIEDILEHVFDFLNVEEIKVCREVNRNWKAVGSKLLRKRCHTIFNFDKAADRYPDTVEKSDVFSSLDQPYADKSSPFSAFSLFGSLLYPAIKTILSNVQESIRELILSGDLTLDDSSGDTFELDSLISPHLKKLHVNQTSAVECILSLDKITNIKNLCLDNCSLVLGEKKIRISPTKISFRDCKYIQNGVDLEIFPVDDFFDLQSAEFVYLEGKNLSLDLSKYDDDKITREVFLTKVRSVNWNKCKWTISTLFLNGVSLTEKNLMTIKEIICTNSTVDISVIQNRPICQAEECISTFLGMDNPFNSPDITSVQLHDGSVGMFPFCYHLNNLRKIEISTGDISLEDRERVEMSIGHLPLNVILRIYNYVLCMKID